MLFKKRKYKKLKERVESILVNYPEIFKYFFSEFELYHAKLKYFKNPEGKYSTNPHPHDPIIDAQRNDFDNFLYGYIGTEVSKKADDRHQELIEINKPILDIRWEIYDLKKKGVHYYDDTEPKTNIYLNFLEYTSIFAWKLNGILEEIENYDKEAKKINEDYLESDFSESENPETINQLDYNDVRNLIIQLKENKIPVKFRSIWTNHISYQLKNEALDNLKSDSDYSGVPDLFSLSVRYGNAEGFDGKKPWYSNFISYVEEIEIGFDEFLKRSFIEEYIEKCVKKENLNDYDFTEFDFSFEDYLNWTNDEDLFYDEATPGWLKSPKKDLIAPLKHNQDELSKSYELNYKYFDDVIEFGCSDVDVRDHNHVFVFDENHLKKKENQITKVKEETKFSFNKVQALKQIDLNWIKGISPIYSVSLTELFENPGRTICYYKTDEESDFYEGEHISIIVKSISEGKDLIDFMINQNGENVSFMNIDNDRIIHKLGYLFDISLVEPEDFDFPIVEINRRKKLDYTSARGEEILHGIHVKSDSIKSKIKGFKKLILNSGELVADGRYTLDANGQKIDSWHSDFSTAFNDVNQVLESSDPENEFLKLNIEEAKNKIIDSGFSYKSENFEMNFYKGNSSWWVNFNLN